MEAQVVTIDQPFHSAYEKFIEITDHLISEMAGDKTHSDIETYLETDGRELLRLLLQDHLIQKQHQCGPLAQLILHGPVPDNLFSLFQESRWEFRAVAR